MPHDWFHYRHVDYCIYIFRYPSIKNHSCHTPLLHLPFTLSITSNSWPPKYKFIHLEDLCSLQPYYSATLHLIQAHVYHLVQIIFPPMQISMSLGSPLPALYFHYKPNCPWRFAQKIFQVSCVIFYYYCGFELSMILEINIILKGVLGVYSKCAHPGPSPSACLIALSHNASCIQPIFTTTTTRLWIPKKFIQVSYESWRFAVCDSILF